MADRTTNTPIDLDALTIGDERRPRLQTLGVIGGSLFVALAATVSLSVLAGVDTHPNSITDQDTSLDNAASTKTGDGSVTILPRGVSLVVPLPPTSTPSLRPSLAPSESMLPSALPSTRPTTSSSPSITPSFTPSQSIKPTHSFLPSRSSVPSSSANPSSSTSPSTKPSFSPTSKPTFLNKFRLRLYWKQGYFWQESYEESWFCLACATCDDNLFNSSCNLQEQCEEGMLLGLVGCEPGKEGKIKGVDFTIKKNLFDDKNKGDMISLYGSDLCISRKGRDVSLQKCTGSKDQRWNGFHPEEEFELQPSGKKRDDKCLTQHHHPKRGERIFAEKCQTARKTKTSLWITF